MASIKTGAPHGLFKVVAQLVGQYGNAYGQAGSGLAQGSDSNALVLDNPRNAGYSPPDRVTVDFTGGDRWITSFQYGITSLGNFDLTLQDHNGDFNAMITGTLNDQTSNTEWTEYTFNEMSSDRPQIALMLIHRMQSFEAATFGQTYYVHTIFPRAWASPKGWSPSFQTAGEPTYQITPASGGRKSTSEVFDANLNAENNQVAAYHIIAPNPLHMVVHRASGATATVVGTYKPISAVVGTANATKNKIVMFTEADQTVLEGVADTITPATGTFAIGTALTPAADDVLHILYETAHELVA